MERAQAQGCVQLRLPIMKLVGFSRPPMDQSKMNYEPRILRLATPLDLRQRLPLDVCGRVFSAIPSLVEGALRMATDGASAIQGRPPAWFSRAADIRLVGYDQQGADTLLALELPKLGEAAEELYKQREFWDTRPDPELTAFDVLRRVVDEVAIENGESAWFDPQLLKRFTQLRRVFGTKIESIRVDDSEKSTALNVHVLDIAARLSANTPPSRQVRILGKLDMIRHSTRSFSVRLENGDEAHGVMASMDAVDQLAGFFGKSILVLGRAVYRPSGALLRIDAAAIEDGSGASPMFSKLPPPQALRRTYHSRMKLAEVGKSGVPAFFGTWPGDESDADLDAMLRDLRHASASAR